MKEKRLGTLLALFGGACWGCSGACGQFLFENYDVTTSWLVPIRLMAGGLIMLIAYLIKSPKETLGIWRVRRNIAPMLVYGLLGITLCQYTYFLTIQWSNAGTAAVLQYISPVLIMAVVCIGERKRPRGFELLALVMAVAGVFMLATHGDFTSLAVSPKVLAIGIFSAGTVVVYNIVPRRLLMEYPASMLLGWAMFTGGIVSAVIFRPWTMQVELDLAGWAAVAAIVFMGSVAGFTLYMLGVKYVGADKASILCAIEPVSAELLSVLWLGSPVYAADVAAFVLIVSTVFVLTLCGRKKVTAK